MTDLRVHHADLGVHDGPIPVFTLHRSGRSRWTDLGVHDGPKPADWPTTPYFNPNGEVRNLTVNNGRVRFEAPYGNEDFEYVRDGGKLVGTSKGRVSGDWVFPTLRGKLLERKHTATPLKQQSKTMDGLLTVACQSMISPTWWWNPATDVCEEGRQEQAW